ncbi:hypothetical protein A2955_04125 [Candidatus Woesebacteria bacterium RIFCSPLOWO2_01_FULL_37_19]|uniref:Lactamase n=1 Tax=Candidatus Woesebacteria bacterium RIFCSPLOWO2_01_FULL_37_19 TaxID=1802514 RepID=A0A1F8B266_9BACT|nr:MAG: hypothetical protein A2955_04125 [Candidatus Woesebacteria bacterium RIFCSPLOWO2_01_FULL_37_19]
MEITYLGHASFRLKGKNAILVTDPFDPKMVGIGFPKITADIVTVSHGHDDHNRSDLVGQVRKVIDGPGEYEVAGISVIGYPSYHDDKKGALRGKNTIYVIEVEGVRVVHLGDLGHKLSEDALEDLGTVDILLIPIGGFYTTGISEAIEIVQSIEPSITIPMHYFVEGMNKENFGKLSGVEEFIKESGLATERVEKLIIKKGEFGEDKKIVILEKKS